MIVLDTNVVSELMRDTPHRGVLDWVAARPTARIHTTALTRAEVLLGIALLPKGRRREVMFEAAERVFALSFAERVLPFDATAAHEYAGIVSSRIRIGRPMATIDAQICAICRAHGATLATRNGTDFDDCDVDVVNPWA